MRNVRLSALDTSFLRMESPVTPMHVGAISRFEGAPLRDASGRFRLDDIRRLVAERVALVPRFRQRLQTVPLGLARPVWVDDPDFDVAYHVNLMTLPSPGSPAQLHRLAEHLHMQLLDRSRPLWELWFVDGAADGTIAQIEKVHHALADGISTVDVATVLCDTTPEVRPTGATLPPPESAPAPAAVLADALVDTLGSAGRAGWALWTSMLHPEATLRRARRFAAGAASLVRPENFAPASSLNRPVSRTRVLVSVELSLEEARSVGHAFGTTVNDVLLAAVTGGLRHLMERRGETVDRTYRALVPVSIRTDVERLGLGNRVAGVLAPLPVGEPDPIERLRAVHAATCTLKSGGQAQAMATLLTGSDLLPAPLIGAIGALVHHQPFVNLVVTNVPGPQHPLYLAGARMLGSVPIVPLGGNLDVSAGVFSYDGQLTFGLFADGERCPDVGVFAEGIERSFVELRRRATRRTSHRRAS